MPGSELTGKEMSTINRIFNIFVSPRTTFESIDRKPDWFIPILIFVIITTIVSFFIMPIALDQQFEQQRIKMQERGMSDEEIETALTMGRKYAEKIGPISAPVSAVIILVIIAAVVYFLGNVILGGKTSFKKILSVISYTSLIGGLGGLLLLPIMLSKKSMNVHFSLATFLPDKSAETVIYQLLKSVDFFMLWQIFVAGIGMAVLYRMSTKKTTTALIVLYVVITLIGVGFRSLM
ncbi:YIP1 family protein [candidate division KSB1 bacterium]|nr:YIP1 family protein [candidate division KSB1 bacterium]